MNVLLITVFKTKCLQIRQPYPLSSPIGTAAVPVSIVYLKVNIPVVYKLLIIVDEKHVSTGGGVCVFKSVNFMYVCVRLFQAVCLTCSGRLLDALIIIFLAFFCLYLIRFN